jgi:hypothetical protein
LGLCEVSAAADADELGDPDAVGGLVGRVAPVVVGNVVDVEDGPDGLGDPGVVVDGTADGGTADGDGLT